MPVDYLSNIPDLSNKFARLGDSLVLAKKQRETSTVMNSYRNDLQAAFDDPTPDNWARLAAKYPQQRSAIKQSWDLLNDEQRDAEFTTAAEVYNSLVNQNTDVALRLVDERIQAMENSGENADKLRNIRSAIETNPQQASSYIAFTLSMIDPNKWSKMSAEGRLAAEASSKLSKSQADARKAAVEADFAQAEAVADLEKKGWDVYKIQENIRIAKENNRIAAMNAQLKREENELKRDQLLQKIDTAKEKRDQQVRDIESKVDSSRTTIDNSLNVIDRILKNPALPDVVGPIEGSKLYPTTLAGAVSPFGASADDRANVVADFETLESQIFLNSLMQLKEASRTGGSGLGALSEKEGERLVTSLQSISRKQGEQRVRNNLREIQRLLLKTRSNLARKYGVPETLPDTPEVTTSPEEIEELIRKYGSP